MYTHPSLHFSCINTFPKQKMAQANESPIVFVVGGTGAQGIPVIRGLVQDGAYRVRFLTRDASSAALRASKTFAEASAAPTMPLFNIDGFNSGEKRRRCSGPSGATSLPSRRASSFLSTATSTLSTRRAATIPSSGSGHYDGKGRIAEWILQQNRSAFSSAKMQGAAVEDGVVTWRVPLGSGAVAHVDLDDCGHYVRWILDHQDRADGLDLEVAIALIPYDELARAFESVTGRPARYVDTDLDTYWTSGPMGNGRRRHRLQRQPGRCRYHVRPRDLEPASGTSGRRPAARMA